jgi:hypothetical protein
MMALEKEAGRRDWGEVENRYELCWQWSNKSVMCIKVIVDEGAIVRDCRRIGRMGGNV